jgi:hypothetical protein
LSRRALKCCRREPNPHIGNWDVRLRHQALRGVAAACGVAFCSVLLPQLLLLLLLQLRLL